MFLLRFLVVAYLFAWKDRPVCTAATSLFVAGALWLLVALVLGFAISGPLQAMTYAILLHGIVGLWKSFVRLKDSIRRRFVPGL